LVALRNAVAADLTQRHGLGRWSSATSEQSVLRGMKEARVLVAQREGVVVGVLRLETKQPWAIDKNYFVPVSRPLYLLDMAVNPAMQRQGIGRRLLDEALLVAKALPADSIRLDAYDHPAGAGGFYARCGFKEVGRVTYRGTPLVYYELTL
jgi:ribosomal protein S18 acetylase RimI-like enzyme